MTDAPPIPPDLSSVRIPTLRDLSSPIPELSADVPLGAVERLFRADPLLRAVAVTDHLGVSLLTRLRLETVLSGRLGFGRALLSRAVAADIVDHGPIHLDADRPLREAAAVLLEGPDGMREEDVLVLDAAGTTLVASVASIFREVGVVFREIALRDPLTGLPNRRMLDERGASLLAGGADGQRIAVLYIDLDGFKQVNDTLGHRVGDQLLIAFAGRLADCVRPSDVLGRLGGDEFAVLLVDVEEDDATAVAERVVSAAQQPFGIDEQQLHVSASVGIAMGRELDGAPPVTLLDSLLQHADGAMLHAKRSGKSRVGRLRVPEAAGAAERRALISSRLRRAIAEDRLDLHYQPKLDLHTGQVESVEALVRWTDDVLGVVTPAELIPIAEHTGQVSALGSWVLGAACRQARRWLDEGRDWAIAVNVSPVQLAAPGLVHEVLDVLDASGLEPRMLQVEITETSAVVDVGLAVEQLAALQTAGVQVHLDDFGTGYSSLARLRRLPVSTLKIDQSIVGRIDSDEADAQLLSGVINAAHTMGLTVVAEGVERRSQLDRLRSLGCDIAQGYLISRPRPAAELPGPAPSPGGRCSSARHPPCAADATGSP